MPDVGTPQATWRDDPEVQQAAKEILGDFHDLRWQAMLAAVAADRRIQAARLRANIEALRAIEAPRGLYGDVARDEALVDVLAVLDAVLGGDS